MENSFVYIYNLQQKIEALRKFKSKSNRIATIQLHVFGKGYENNFEEEEFDARAIPVKLCVFLVWGRAGKQSPFSLSDLTNLKEVNISVQKHHKS